MTDPPDVLVPEFVHDAEDGRSTVTRVLRGIGIAALLALIGVVIWGFVYHPGYDEVIPGSTQPIPAKISVTGVKQFSPKGNFYLVFVRERTDVNYWEYVRAQWFDDHAQINKIEKGAPAPVPHQDFCFMQDSQATAKQVALRKLGYKLNVKPGVLIVGISEANTPVSKVLTCGDTIRSVAGVKTDSQKELSAVIGQHRPGDAVEVVFDRAAKQQTQRIRLIRDREGKTRLGVLATPTVQYPFQLSIDTGEIGGPSAGLAMTLTLLDELTPGELTGNQKVAATGTIEPDGTVGEIGAIDLKAIAVQQRHAKIFLVPACQEDPKQYPKELASCQEGIRLARKNAPSVLVIPVRNLDDALRALREHGGEPLPAIASK